MGFADKLLNMMKFNDTDEYEDDFSEEYEELTDEYDEPEEESEEEPERKPILSFRRKRKDEPVENIRMETDNRVIPFHGRKDEGDIVKVI